MTIATFTDQSLVPAERPTPDATVDRLIRWAEGARAAHSLADALCRTPFCPKAFQGKPIEAAAAMLAGSELGLSPLAALRSFDVIEGAAAPRAITLRAVVQSQGHEIVVVESTATRCRVKGRRKGEENWQESVWTIDRAAKLKLTGKSNWQNQPQGMLLARATSECARMVASDAILGVPYAAEELADEASEDAPAATRTVRRQTVRAIPAQSAPDLPPLPDEDEQPAPEGITKPQLTKLAICLKEAGMTDREMGLSYLSNVIGRDIESSKDLTKDEASRVIEDLASYQAPAPVAPITEGEPDGWAVPLPDDAA